LAVALLSACGTATPEPTQAPAVAQLPANTLSLRATTGKLDLKSDGDWSATVQLDVLNGQPPFAYESAWPRAGSGEPPVFNISASTCRAIQFAAKVTSADGQQGSLNIGFRPTGCAEIAAAPTVVPTDAPAPATAPPADTTAGVPAGDALEMLNRINALRAQNGLPPYAYNAQLAAAALRHAQDMANTGNISHTGSDDSSARDRILAAGYPATATSEGIYGGASLDDAYNFFSTDPDHRPSLLSTQFTEIGVAAVKGDGFLTYYTIDFGAR
jgi:uncharacterized protein YkwD